MQITIEHLGRKYRCDLSKGIDLSSVLGNPTKELKAWYVESVKKSPVKMGDWTGSVKEGAPVNFFDIKFNPHGNGTHTECYGHISHQHENLNEQIKEFHFLAYLAVLEPEDRQGDKIISLESLQKKVRKWNFEALIIKSGNYKAGHNFSSGNPPYFEPQFLSFVKDMGVEHFLTDLPSVDREEDGGALAAHKAFWEFPDNPRKGATISELLLIPDNIQEGLYLLNLQIAPFENDASPARPVIYKVEG